MRQPRFGLQADGVVLEAKPIPADYARLEVIARDLGIKCFNNIVISKLSVVRG
jgi:hypothetical protein